MNYECNKNQLSANSAMRYPLDGTFELTVRCNLHCKMCLFRHDDSENKKIISQELPAEHWIALAKQVAEAGTFSLLLTGGEPMIREDFCELYEGIYRQGFQITLYTNATLVTDKVMEILKKYPPHRIGITIYGASAATYKKVCGVSGAYDRMIEGVNKLRTLPSMLDFRTTIIKDNYEDIEAIEKLIHDYWGKEQTLTQTRMVTQSVRGACEDVTTCRLSPEDNVRLAYRRGINIIKKYVGSEYDEKNLRLQYRYSNNKSKNVARPTLFGCDAGMNSYTISWDGKLLACQMLGAFCVDLLKLSFIDAWNRFPSLVKLPQLHPDCQSCPSIDLCSCCVASRYAETGELGGKPDYVCSDTKIINKLLEDKEL